MDREVAVRGWDEQLRARGYRVTPQRQLVLEAVARLDHATPEEIVHAIRVVAAGEALLAPSVTARLIGRFASLAPPRPAASVAELTDREREVLVLVARGLSNAEIAEELVVSHATVKTHVSRILAKLDARDRAQLVVHAYESGLVARRP